MVGQSVVIEVSIRSSGLATLATANDITYRNDLFDSDPTRCTINPSLGKTLLTSTLPRGSDPTLTTLRAFVQATQNAIPIPDGTLYRCVVTIRATTLPGTYRFEVGSTQAFGPGAVAHPFVQGRSGDVEVSLIATCAGDCNEDGAVTIDELIAGIGIALGNGSASNCTAADVNRDGEITIDELLAGINRGLTGCTSAASVFEGDV